MKNNPWTEEEIEFLIKNYSSIDNEELSNKMDRSVSSIRNKSNKLNLEKTINRKTWKDNELNFLKKNFSNLSNQELSDKLNRSIKSITKKASELKLKKSKEHISKQIGKRNKIVGKDWTYDMLVNIAAMYKTRSEFQRKDSAAYSAAKKNGWLNDVCSHMINISFSIPQILLGEIMKNLFGENNVIMNDRKTISPYELDIYIPKYKLAFEYDGKRWHLNNKNDEIKNNICIDKDIKLIRIVENNRKYETDVKNQLIKNLNIINNHCNTNFTKDDIISSDVTGGFDNILDEKGIKKIISKYNDYSKFKSDNPKLYQKLVKLRKLDDFTKDLDRNRIYWNENKIDEEISKYEYLDDFIKNSFGCYSYIMKHNMKYKLSRLKRKREKWDINKIKKVILDNKYRTIYQLKKDYPGIIGFLRKNDLIDEIRSFINDRI